VQAQDYLASLWAIGQRVVKADESTIEKAIGERRIVRTWPMRGTLHLADPENVRWMLRILTPRVLTRAASIYRQAELDKKIFLKSAKLFEKALTKNALLTRDEMYDVLERAKITTANTRGLHILGYVAQQGLICFGPRKGKQPTFTLLDEWLPATKELSVEEALAKLALIYFRSHGPATLHDFAWWTGLTKTEATHAHASVREKLISETIGSETYWMSPPGKMSGRGASSAHLLPVYDEYTVGYTDRSHFLDPIAAHLSGNGIFSPVMVINGKVEGTWKRTLEKEYVNIELNPFRKLTVAERAGFKRAASAYAAFVSKGLKTRFSK
jgi:hypothetical protein